MIYLITQRLAWRQQSLCYSASDVPCVASRHIHLWPHVKDLGAQCEDSALPDATVMPGQESGDPREGSLCPTHLF